MAKNPCITCGACCAFFRVAFYWRELAESGRVKGEPNVPERLTEDGEDNLKCMRGTTTKHRQKCIALTGKIGEATACRIYVDRPSPCREFVASFEYGVKNVRCDQARAAHGLPRLSRQDWLEPTQPERKIA